MPLLRGVTVTLQLFFMSSILVFLSAFVVGFGRLSKYMLIRAVANIYVEIFRGTSLLVQLFWAFFVLPFFGIELAPLQAGVIILGLHFGAYASEVVRSTILSVPRTQYEAGIALNFQPNQIMFRIILPQAFLVMLPSFGNYLIELLKATALVSLIALTDLMFQGVKIYTTTLRTLEVFALVLIIYFIIIYPLTLGVRWFEQNLSKGRA
jgi:polar amino acid transport system permease protein